MEGMQQEDTQLEGSLEVDNPPEGGILQQGGTLPEVDILQEVEGMYPGGILHDHDHGVKTDPFHHAFACPSPCLFNQEPCHTQIAKPLMRQT